MKELSVPVIILCTSVFFFLLHELRTFLLSSRMYGNSWFVWWSQLWWCFLSRRLPARASWCSTASRSILATPVRSTWSRTWTQPRSALPSTSVAEQGHLGRSWFEDPAPAQLKKVKKIWTTFSSFVPTMIKGKLKKQILKNKRIFFRVCSVAEPEPPGAGADFFWVGAGSRSRLF